MKKAVVLTSLAAVLGLTSPGPARAGSTEDVALGLAAFAVFNQVVSGQTVFQQYAPRPQVVVAPPPVVYAPPPPVVYAPPPAVVYRAPRAVYAPPRTVIYAPPRPVHYGHGSWVPRGGHWVWVSKPGHGHGQRGHFGKR